MKECLEESVRLSFDELHVPNEERDAVFGFLAPIKIKHAPTYLHCLRVGLLSRNIARVMHLDEKALFYAGLLHDVGKALVPLETVAKTQGWTPADTQAMKTHVEDSVRLIRGRFDFTADVIKYHHWFQEQGYPEVLPENAHGYGRSTETLLKFYGRLLSVADVYDALHRVNDKFGEKKSLSGDDIKAQMIKSFPDLRKTIEDLYLMDILTIRESEENVTKQPSCYKEVSE